MKSLLSLVLFCLIALLSCSPSKQLMSDAAMYEQSGMTKEAFDLYKQAYQVKPSNVDAHIAARKLGDKMLNDLLLQMQWANTKGEFEKAMDIFVQTESFYSTNKYLGLMMPSQFSQVYEEARTGKVNQLYTEAEALVLEGNFDKAQNLIQLLLRYDRNHEKAEYLSILAELYPSYTKGEKAKALGLYKEAYFHFKAVTDVDIEFKDAWNQQQQCAELAAYTLAYIPIHKSGLENEIEIALGTAVNQSILALNDPFIKLLDRQNMATLIQEQQVSMSAFFDEDKALAAGRFEGAKYVITGEIIGYSNQLGRKIADEKKGYLGKTIVAPKVRYQEYSQNRVLTASFKFQVLNTETGQILLTETIPFTESDATNYIVFDGDASSLYAGDWKFGLLGSRTDVVYNSKEAEVDKKLAARREPYSKVEMDYLFIDYVGHIVANKIAKFQPGG
jgi:tetratricopeptide (TPR) repeat protein